MIEIYAFFAMLALLILTVSVMHMAVLVRFLRLKTAEVPDEYFAQLYPGVDRQQSTEQFVTRYRAAHAVIALSGALLLSWLINYMRQPDWDKRWVIFPLVVYFVLQWLPMAVAALAGFKHLKMFKSFLVQAKRKAVLKRRGLFDFVSPIIVAVAALAYLLCIGFVVYMLTEPLARLLFIGAVTFNYVLTALTIYKLLYGKKSDPFETHTGRLYNIALRAKSSIYSCIAVALFMSFIVAVIRSDLQRWIPFALAAFLTIVTLITFSVFTAPPGRLEADDLNSSGAAS
jgi:hypothetical protein